MPETQQALADIRIALAEAADKAVIAEERATKAEKRADAAHIKVRRLTLMVMSALAVLLVVVIVLAEYFSSVNPRRAYVDDRLNRLSSDMQKIFCLVPPGFPVNDAIRRQAKCGPYIKVPKPLPHSSPSGYSTPTATATGSSVVGLPAPRTSSVVVVVPAPSRSTDAPHPSTPVQSVTRIASRTPTHAPPSHPPSTRAPGPTPTPTRTTPSARPNPIGSLVCIVTAIVRLCPTSS